jgi:hypothetical protein
MAVPFKSFLIALFAVVFMGIALSLSACVPPPEEPTSQGFAPRPTGSGEVLIFTGASAWWPEVDSLRVILEQHGVTVRGADSVQLDRMSLEDLSAYRVVIFPGGDSIEMTRSLRSETHQKIREAVQERGITYMGFCAGAWATPTFGVFTGPPLKVTLMEERGAHHAMSRVSLPGGARRNLLWYGGPITPDSPGGVVARYPDGTPAITQMRSGRGWVVMSGVHPAATPFVINSLGLNDDDGQDYDLAWRMLDSALSQRAMDAF